MHIKAAGDSGSGRALHKQGDSVNELFKIACLTGACASCGLWTSKDEHKHRLYQSPQVKTERGRKGGDLTLQ